MKNYAAFPGRFLLPLLLIFSAAAIAMPPHPDLAARLAKSPQQTPYYLQHRAELLAKGVDAPEHPRSLDALHRSVLDSNFPILVILVDFSDNVSHVAGSSFDNLLFGNQTGSLKNYYQQVTYGNLTVVTVNLPSALGWARAPQTYAYYVNNQNGFGTYPHNAQKLVEDAVNAVDPFVDFSQYDSDGDGSVEGLFIAHAGRGAEYTGSNSDIWSHAWGTYYTQHLDGVNIRQYSMEPEYWASYGDMTCGVYAHEMGHAVFGLPDFYDTGYESEGLGRWSLMAAGSWNGYLGNSPAHPDAWCKIAMGVVSPTIVSSNLIGASIPQVETNPMIYRLWTNGAAGSQYMLVENRQKTGYDSGLPAGGLLIYHIDNSMYGNDNPWYPGQPNGSHYQVALEQADGLWQLEHNTSTGDGGDPYPGSTNNHTYNDTSTPDSKSYAQATTNVAVQNISASGATMTADLLVGTSCTPPPQVTGLVATNDHCNDVALTWTDGSGETGYRVYRNGSQIGSDLAANATSYSDLSGGAGTSYNYTVAAFNGSCVGTASAAASGTRLASPAQVTGVAATTTHCADVTITWNDVANETGYRVLRNGVQVGSDLAANTTSYVDGSAAPGTTYSYTVIAFNASCSGPTSSAASGVRLVTPSQVPGVAASTNRCSDVQITWSDVSGEAGYRLYRDGSQIGGDLPANTISYLDANAAPSTAYNYSVLAFNGTCIGTVSATASGSRSSGPAQVTGATASTDRCADVLIAWTAVGGATGYRVYRNGTQIGSDLGSGTTSYNDAAANPGTSYSYTVAALSGSCLGPASNGSSGARMVTPAQVTDVSATTTHCGDIVVTWSDLSNETAYRVYRNGTQIGSDQPANTTNFTDTSPTPGVSYNYAVAALNGACTGQTSAASAGMRATTPAQVTGVSATTNRCTDVRISWTDLSNTTAFRVFRNGLQLSGDLPAHTVLFTDSTGSSGVSYNYAVCALNGTCVGTLSNTASGMRAAAVAQVSGVTASSNHCGDVTLAWSDLTNETGYRVFRNGVQFGSDLAANIVSLVDNSAVPGTTYGYAVAGLNGTCSGPVSAAANGLRVPTPNAVAGVWASTDRCSEVVVVWNLMPNATGYRVYRNSTQISYLPSASASSFTDTTAAAGTTYNYAVSAFNGSCEGVASATVTGSRATVPPQVTTLSATTDRCSDIHITWQDVSGETGYRFSRNGQLIATFPAGTTSYYDTSVTAGISYSYAIQPFNGSCDGPASAPASGSRLITPNQVTGVTATMERCADIQIAWNDVANAGGFRVFRNGVLISGNLPAHTTTFSDTSGTPGVNYGYTVAAFSGICSAPLSGAANGMRPATPSQVLNVNATQNHCGDIQITWMESVGAIGYKLYRNGAQIGSDLPTHSVSYSDASATAGVAYDYTVRAFSGNCFAPLSLSATGMRVSACAAVSGVLASDDRCNNIMLTWNAQSEADSFQIRRNGARIGGVESAVHSFADSTAAVGTFLYRVVAFNRCGAGDSSGFDTGTRRGTPNAVSSINASRERCSDVLLSWSLVSGASGYTIWRENDSIATVAVNVNSFSDANAQAGMNYNYRVRAFNDCGGAAFSTTVSGWRLPLPAVVVGVNATDDRCDSIVITWNTATGASGYRVLQDGVLIGTVGIGITRLATAPVPGTHAYAIAAENVCGTVALSASDNGTRWEAPGAPANLSATNAACGQILLTWSAASGHVDNYQLLRDGTVIDIITGLSFTDNITGEHTYHVRAHSAFCGAGAPSQAATGIGHDVLPAVTELTASSSCTIIEVNWMPVAGALGYLVYRGSDSIGVVESGTHTFSDLPAAPGTYTYRVSAFNVCGHGMLSNSASGTRRSAPDIVSGLSASQFDCQGVSLAWTDAPDEISYTIFRNGESLAVLTADAVSFMDSSAVPGVSYDYAVRANNDCGAGALSITATGVRRAAPPEVTHVTATNDRCDSVMISWIGWRGDLVYQIFRDTSLVGETTADVMQFADAPPVGEHTYSVRTHNLCGSSLLAAPATGVRLAPALPPTTVIASDTLCGVVAVTWSGATGTINDYEILRNGTAIGSVPAYRYQYIDTVAAGEYTYAVRARGTCGDSPTDATDNGTCHETPGIPPNLTVPAEACDHVQLAWMASRGAVEVYLVYRDGVLFDSTNSILYSDTTLHSAGQHTYRITARDPYCGESAPSAPTTAGLLPLTSYTGTFADTVRSADSLRIALDHCSGVTSDSAFISLRGGTFEFLAAYAPVRSSILVVVPRLDSVNTPDCRILLISYRDARADSIMSPAFVIYSPPPDAAPERETALPQTVVLDQNYPNPFNPATTIRFGLPRATDVTVEIFDVLGRKLTTLMSGNQSAGVHTATWNGADYATGVYFVRLRAGQDVLMRKMMLLK
jgi:immune inhibitor A